MGSTLLTNSQCTTLNGFDTSLLELGPRPKPHHFQDQEGISNRVKPLLGQLWRSVCWWQSQEPLEQSRGHSNGELTTNDLHRGTLRARGIVINNYTGTAGVSTGSSQGNWDVALYAWAFFLVSTRAYTFASPPSIPSPQSLFSQTLAYSLNTSLLIRVSTVITTSIALAHTCTLRRHQAHPHGRRGFRVQMAGTGAPQGFPTLPSLLICSLLITDGQPIKWSQILFLGLILG